MLQFEIVVNSQSRSFKVVSLHALYVVTYYCYTVTVRKTYLTSKCRDLEQWIKRSVSVIEGGTIRQSTYDVLLTFPRNYGPNSYRFRHRRRYQS